MIRQIEGPIYIFGDKSAKNLDEFVKRVAEEGDVRLFLGTSMREIEARHLFSEQSENSETIELGHSYVNNKLPNNVHPIAGDIRQQGLCVPLDILYAPHTFIREFSNTLGKKHIWLLLMQRAWNHSQLS